MKGASEYGRSSLPGGDESQTDTARDVGSNRKIAISLPSRESAADSMLLCTSSGCPPAAPTEYNAQLTPAYAAM